jgi:hypothetical protein
MSIVRPNRVTSFTGARWVLKKHVDWSQEFEAATTLSFSGTSGTHTDLDGHDWTMDGTGGIVRLDSDGVFIEDSGGGESSVEITPKDFIPGIKPSDHIWVIWRLKDISVTINGHTFECQWYRNEGSGEEQAARFGMGFSGGVSERNVKIETPGAAVSTKTTTSSLTTAYFSINTQGLRYEYRRQAATTAFPSTPQPEDINLETLATTFGGAWGGDMTANPDTEDVDHDTEVLRVRARDLGNPSTSGKLVGMWVYRLE